MEEILEDEEFVDEEDDEYIRQYVNENGEFYDRCYECGGYGDDYYINDKGELVCACDDCPYNEPDWFDPWDE